MNTKARLLQFQTHAKALELKKTRGLQIKAHAMTISLSRSVA